MNQKMNQKTNEKIQELKEIIQEQKEWGNLKVARIFEEELNTLLANEALVGNKPRRSF